MLYIILCLLKQIPMVSKGLSKIDGGELLRLLHSDIHLHLLVLKDNMFSSDH